MCVYGRGKANDMVSPLAHGDLYSVMGCRLSSSSLVLPQLIFKKKKKKQLCSMHNLSYLVQQWNLVCTRDYLPDLSQTILMAGYAVGSIMAGPLADKYGRRLTQLVSVIVLTILCLAVSLSPNYFVYVSLRFICGAVVMVSLEPSSYPVSQVCR